MNSEKIIEMKVDLRKKFRHLRSNLSQEDIEQQKWKSERICQHAFDWVRVQPRFQSIGCYHSLPGEVETYLLMQCFFEIGIKLSLPRMKQERLFFHQWSRDQPLIQNCWGIWEPEEIAPIVNPDLLFMPLLAYGPQGERLGLGKGYYDRALEQSSASCLKIGLAYAFQYAPTLEAEKHDIMLDGIVTENGIQWF